MKKFGEESEPVQNFLVGLDELICQAEKDGIGAMKLLHILSTMQMSISEAMLEADEGPGGFREDQGFHG